MRSRTDCGSRECPRGQGAATAGRRRHALAGQINFEPLGMTRSLPVPTGTIGTWVLIAEICRPVDNGCTIGPDCRCPQGTPRSADPPRGAPCSGRAPPIDRPRLTGKRQSREQPPEELHLPQRVLAQVAHAAFRTHGGDRRIHVRTVHRRQYERTVGGHVLATSTLRRNQTRQKPTHRLARTVEHERRLAVPRQARMDLRIAAAPQSRRRCRRCRARSYR